MVVGTFLIDSSVSMYSHTGNFFFTFLFPVLQHSRSNHERVCDSFLRLFVCQLQSITSCCSNEKELLLIFIMCGKGSFSCLHLQLMIFKICSFGRGNFFVIVYIGDVLFNRRIVRIGLISGALNCHFDVVGAGAHWIKIFRQICLSCACSEFFEFIINAVLGK